MVLENNEKEKLDEARPCCWDWFFRECMHKELQPFSDYSFMNIK